MKPKLIIGVLALISIIYAESFTQHNTSFLDPSSDN